MSYVLPKFILQLCAARRCMLACAGCLIFSLECCADQVEGYAHRTSCHAAPQLPAQILTQYPQTSFRGNLFSSSLQKSTSHGSGQGRSMLSASSPHSILHAYLVTVFCAESSVAIC